MKEINQNTQSEEAIAATEKMIELVRHRQERKEAKAVEEKIDEKGKPRARLTKAEEKLKILETWIPKTKTGKLVKAGEIKSIEDIYQKGLALLEPEIVDMLIPELEEIVVGFNKTCKVTRSGRNYAFVATVLVGDGKGHVGVGTAKDTERHPAVRKATKAAKLNMVSVRYGCGSWECVCGTNHSVPFKVEGKSGSVRVILQSAPRGIGLAVGESIKPVLRLAGVSDVWGYTKGRSVTTLNFIRAAIDALSKTRKMKMSNEMEKKA